jgi:hypothetical protein
MRFKVVSLAALCCAILAAQPQVGPVPPQPPAPTDGPTELIITYRCPPPHRAAFRQFMTENGILRFEHWKQDGMLKEYRFLFNWYVDVDSWDAMVVLSFSSYAQVARWKLVEHASPGGLIRDALEMAWPLNTTPADLITRGESDQPWNSANSVFVAVPYDAPAPSNFRDFANTTLTPQLKAWMRDGSLVSYRVYSNRYAGGKRWQGMLLLEYHDMDAFGHAHTLPKDSRVTERESVAADAVISH